MTRPTLIITPVKDSLETTIQTIRSVRNSSQDEYILYDDFSKPETRIWLEENTGVLNYNLVGLENHVKTKSPNYRTTLRLATDIACEWDCDLLIIESDVIVQDNTIQELKKCAALYPDAGLIGALTTDKEGNINFPYLHLKKQDPHHLVESKNSISFCCTLITRKFLDIIASTHLPENLDWYDVYLSRLSRSSGLNNYVAGHLRVVHRPHSSRPWKLMKYSSPVRYYWQKLLLSRDRI